MLLNLASLLPIYQKVSDEILCRAFSNTVTEMWYRLQRYKSLKLLLQLSNPPFDKLCIDFFFPLQIQEIRPGAKNKGTGK